MELSQHEKIAIQTIMNTYRSIHDLLNYYENRLDEISNSEDRNPHEILEIGGKIRSCINRLKKERERESLLFKKMERKYGAGDLDPVTLEYRLKGQRHTIKI